MAVTALRPLLLVAAILIGQAHAYQLAYRCTDGAICDPCGFALNASDLGGPDGCCRVVLPQKDCHQCCVLAPIGPGHHQNAHGSGHVVTPEVHLAEVVALVAPTPVQIPLEHAPSRPPYLPHAPPDLSASRAPPVPAA